MILGAVALPGHAQQISGTWTISVTCGGARFDRFSVGDGAANQHGECVAGGAVASINDAGVRWSFRTGDWSVRMDSRSDYRGSPNFDGVFTLATPLDGTLVDATTNRVGVQLTANTQFWLSLDAYADIVYCAGQPPAIGQAVSGIRVAFPCTGPVFNLPPGITANSARFGIVNNRFVGAVCCPADFNGDAFLDFFDFDDFVTAFDAGC